MIRAFEVALTIPDNTASTALTALERLGVGCDALERSDVYVFDVAADVAPELEAILETIETIYNPNKHVLRARDDAPGAGEIWVGETSAQGASPPGGKEPSMKTFRIAGRALDGVRSLRRFTSWRLSSGGRAVSPAVAASAADQLLYNPAFQELMVGR